MTDDVQNVWQTAESQFFDKLVKKDQVAIQRFNSVEEFLAHVESLSNHYANRKSSRAFKKLRPTLDRLWYFNKSAQSFLQASPKTFVLVWGSLSIVLQLSLKYAHWLDVLADCLGVITQASHRIRECTALFEPTPNELLYRTLVEYYSELISFFYEAVKVFNRRFYSNFWRSSLKITQSTRLAKLQNLTDQFDQEAHVTGFSRILKRLPSSQPGHYDCGNMLLGGLPYDNLPRRKEAFFGREPELDALSSAFSDNNPRLTMGLHGLPGSGKSQIALEFAYRKLEDETYTAVFWISADTKVKLFESFGVISKGLGILDSEMQTNHELQQQALLRWLEKTSKPGSKGDMRVKWLVVFDNVSDRSLLEDYWHVICRGSVIVTCRSPEIASQYARKRLQIGSFETATAQQFLLTFLKTTETHSEKDLRLARTISEAVGNHPLALDMIGCHIRRCGKSLEHFTRDHPAFERDWVFHPDLICGSEGANERSVSDVFSLSSHGILDNDTPARLLICMLAFLDPDGVPLDLFTGHTKESMLCDGPDDPEKFPNLQDTLHNPFEDCETFDRARKTLLDLALITMDDNNAKIRCHRLVRSATRRTMAAREIALVLNKTVFLLNSAFPSQEAGEPLLSQWARCDAFASSIVSVLDSYTNEGDTTHKPILLAEIVCRCSWYYYEKGWLGTSEKMADRAIALCEQAASRANHPGFTAWYLQSMISHQLNTKGAIDAKMSRPDHGLEMASRVLDIRLRIARPDDAQGMMWIGAAMGNLVIPLMATGRPTEALTMLQEILARGDLRANEDTYLSNLCLCYYLLSRYEEAMSTSDLAMNSIRSLGESEHAKMATVLFYQSNIQERMGNVEAARTALDACLDIRGRLMPFHPETGFTYHRQGVLLSRRGDYPKAFESLVKALEIFSSCEVHPGAYCRTTLELGAVAQRHGDNTVYETCLELAEQYRQKIEDVDTGMLGNNPSGYDKFVYVGLR